MIYSGGGTWPLFLNFFKVEGLFVSDESKGSGNWTYWTNSGLGREDDIETQRIIVLDLYSMADTWKYMLPVQNVYQDPVLNTKGADVAHGKVEGIRRDW